MSAKNPTENAISELEISWLERTEKQRGQGYRLARAGER